MKNQVLVCLYCTKYLHEKVYLPLSRRKYLGIATSGQGVWFILKQEYLDEKTILAVILNHVFHGQSQKKV